MTYYRVNTKFIDNAEDALAQPKHKVAAVLEWVVPSLWAAACMGALAVKQHIAAIFFFMFAVLVYWGLRDKTWRQMLLKGRKIYLSTVTLNQENVSLHNGIGELERTVRYGDIYKVEKTKMRASVQPITRGRAQPHREEFWFIVLHIDIRKIPQNPVLENYLEDDGLIIFPFYPSAWQLLTEKLPDRISIREE